MTYIYNYLDDIYFFAIVMKSKLSTEVLNKEELIKLKNSTVDLFSLLSSKEQFSPGNDFANRSPVHKVLVQRLVWFDKRRPIELVHKYGTFDYRFFVSEKWEFEILRQSEELRLKYFLRDKSNPTGTTNCESVLAVNKDWKDVAWSKSFYWAKLKVRNNYVKLSSQEIKDLFISLEENVQRIVKEVE